MKLQLIFINILALTVSFKIHKSNQQINGKQNLNGNAISHDYYNLENTKIVSQSKSIKYLNQCKELCLQMHKLFPFQFKYHRVIYRQEQGDMKYITGHCLYTFKSNQKKLQKNILKKSKTKQESNKKLNNQKSQKKWYNWDNLKQFVDMPSVFDKTYEEQKKAWHSYSRDCEDQSVKLSQNSKLDFKFIVIHSNFQYYENQGFKNLQPFDDIGDLFKGLKPRTLVPSH